MSSDKSSTDSSSPTLGSSSTRAQKRGSRTTNACEACKKRKTKCTGSPGRCDSCTKNDTFCHFNLRLDTRRKLAYKPTAVRERQLYLLEGILQILKHNDSRDVQALLKLIRSEARPQDIANSLSDNLGKLQKRGFIRLLEIDEADLVSLGLQGLYSHRAGKNGSKVLDPADADVQIEEMHESPREATSTSDDTSVSDDFKDLTHQLAYKDSDNFHVYPQGTSPLSASHNVYCSQGLTTTLSSLHSNSSDEYASQGNGGTLSTPVSSSFSSHYDQRQLYDYPPYFGVSARLPQQLDVRILHLPLSSPRSPLDSVCLTFRDTCRDLLASGHSFDQLNNYGRMDCELLFRDRGPSDHWNIPNWACEAARTFPNMLPETRLAAALCMTRFMPFLIDPSAKSLDALPGVLRPTKLQMRISHDVSINFIPVPMLRDCLVQNSVDWLQILGDYDYRVRWDGNWGDIGGAYLGKAGSWQYDPVEAAREKPSHSPPSAKGKRNDAIIHDSTTGRRFISEEYEDACWIFENYSIRRDVLQFWPELSGHIMLA